MSYGTPAIFARGKVWVRRLPDVDSFSPRADFFTRDALIAQDGDRFSTNAHWHTYPAVLIRLAPAGPDQIDALLIDSWRTFAGTKLVAAWEGTFRRAEVTGQRYREAAPYL